MTATRLRDAIDLSAYLAHDTVPVGADVTLHDEEGREYAMRVYCARAQDIMPAAEFAAERLGLDLGASEWEAIS